MKSSLIIAAGSAIAGVLGLPSNTAGQVESRDAVKLNQYRNMDDWCVYGSINLAKLYRD